MANIMMIAVSIGLACGVPSALAQESTSRWYIQPSVSYVEPDPDFGADEHDGGAGVRFGRPIAERWDLQIGASDARADQGEFHYRQRLVGADALLMMSRKKFRPFLLVGIGAQRDRMENPRRHVHQTSPYINAGLGMQIGLTPQWSMQADLRSVRGRLRHDDAFGFEKSNTTYLTIGVAYALNRRAAPAPRPSAHDQPPAPSSAFPSLLAAAPARLEKITLDASELFEFDSATLGPAQLRLDQIAVALSTDPSITDVDIAGYADRLGSAAYNLTLSQQRAGAVRDYLVAKGIDGARLKAYGKGQTNPLVSCANRERHDLITCLAPNRRVEVERITIERRASD